MELSALYDTVEVQGCGRRNGQAGCHRATGRAQVRIYETVPLR